MDSIDKIIWVLPVLAVLDVASTFYVDSLGYSLARYERGFFASIFVNAGLVYAYVYAAIYLFIIVGITYVLWYMKNRKLKRSEMFDKVIFIVLVGVTCFFYVRLTMAFLTNFLLPYILGRCIGLFWLDLIVVLSALFTLAYYLWHDVTVWLMSDDGEQKQ